MTALGQLRSCLPAPELVGCRGSSRRNRAKADQRPPIFRYRGYSCRGRRCLRWALVSQEETLALPQGGGAPVADHAMREAAQDRRTHGPPRPQHHLPVGRGGRLAAGVRANPGTDRPAACAAGAGLIEVITARGKATGEVCLDDGKTGVQCDETAAGVDPRGWRSVWSQPVNFTIVAEGGPEPSRTGCPRGLEAEWPTPTMVAPIATRGTGL